MKIKPLTDAQQHLAEENHDLVYAFLNQNGLSVEHYYDVVVFGLLYAAQAYDEKPGLKHYRFSTIAWRRMSSVLKDYHKYLSAQKNLSSCISLHEPISAGSPHCWEDVLPDQCDALGRLQVDLILHSVVPTPRERRIIRMKQQGEKMHDIAKAEKLTFQEINRILTHVQRLLAEALYS